QLAVGDGPDVEQLLVVLEREVQVRVVDVPVVIFAIDQVVRLLSCLVLCRIKEVSDTVRLFANVVARDYNSKSAWETLSLALTRARARTPSCRSVACRRARQARRKGIEDYLTLV